MVDGQFDADGIPYIAQLVGFNVSPAGRAGVMVQLEGSLPESKPIAPFVEMP